MELLQLPKKVIFFVTYGRISESTLRILCYSGKYHMLFITNPSSISALFEFKETEYDAKQAFGDNIASLDEFLQYVAQDGTLSA